MRALVALQAVLVALAAVGCQNPYRDPPDRAPDANPRRGDSVTRGGPQRSGTDDLPPVASGRDTAPSVPRRPLATPTAAVAAFCGQWINWRWHTIARQQRRLAGIASGSLAEQLASEAQLRDQDEALRRDRVGEQGRVIAVAVNPGERTRRAVCVALEERIEDGRRDLLGARHRVYLATTAETPEGWAITRWEPQP